MTIVSKHVDIRTGSPVMHGSKCLLDYTDVCALLNERFNPDVFDALDLTSKGFAKAVLTSPSYDSVTQYATETLATQVGGVWTQQWAVSPKAAPDIATSLALAVKNGIAKIDFDTDALYGAVLGNRWIEYQDACTAATAFKAAGYSGTVPPEVQSWATAKGWTAVAAADDILATAATWKGAQASIRATRLAQKEAVRSAADEVAVNAALSAWSAFIVTIKTALGIV